MKHIIWKRRNCLALCLAGALLFCGCAADVPGTQGAPNPGSQGNSKPITQNLTANLEPRRSGQHGKRGGSCGLCRRLQRRRPKLRGEPVISPLSAYFGLAMWRMCAEIPCGSSARCSAVRRGA